MTISGQLFATYIVISQKTEVQTVILRCWLSLNLKWYKSYNITKQTQFSFFLQNHKKNENRNIWVLWHNFWANYDLDLLSISNNPSEPQFCERWTYIWQKSGQKWLYDGHLRVTFVSDQSLHKLFDLRKIF